MNNIENALRDIDLIQKFPEITNSYFMPNNDSFDWAFSYTLDFSRYNFVYNVSKNELWEYNEDEYGQILDRYLYTEDKSKSLYDNVLEIRKIYGKKD